MQFSVNTLLHHPELFLMFTLVKGFSADVPLLHSTTLLVPQDVLLKWHTADNAYT